MTRKIKKENEYYFNIETKLKYLEKMRKTDRAEKVVCCGVATLLLASTCYVFATTNDFGYKFLSGVLSIYGGFILAITFSQFRKLLKASNLENHYKRILETYLMKNKKTFTKEEFKELGR